MMIRTRRPTEAPGRRALSAEPPRASTLAQAPQRQARLRSLWPDLGLLSLFSLLHAAVLWRINAFEAAPAEDAAILLRYSQHLAGGHGIVWNVGQHPVDGATDFLYMVLVALLHFLGIGLLSAARALDLVGTFATIAAAYAVGRVLFRQPRWVSSLGPLLVAIGPAGLYTGIGFGAPFFGLGVAAAAICACLMVRRPTFGRALGFGLASLFMGLVRPEGVILAALLGAAALLVLPRRARARLVEGVVAGLVVPGAAYFAFRWAYFGFPLPNPYYKKGGGALHPDGLLLAVKGMGRWFSPLIVLYALPLKAWRRTWRYVLAYGLPVAGFTVVWVLLSPEMNEGYRFQYPLLVLLALSIPGLWALTVSAWSATSKPASELRRRLVPLFVAAAGVNLLVVGIYTVRSTIARSRDPLIEVGSALSGFKAGNPLLATTEAGLVPLASGWRTLDLWGLNDEQIAHSGLTVARLRRDHPAVIVLHYVSGATLHGWNAMLRTVETYMRQTGDYLSVAHWTWESGGMRVVYLSTREPRKDQIAAAVCSALAGVPTERCSWPRAQHASPPVTPAPAPGRA